MIGVLLLALVGVWLVVNFVQGPSRFLSVVIIGLTNGSVYALIALGYTLVYGILQLINFAHGDVFALSGLVASSFIISTLGLDTSNAVLSIVGGIVLTLIVIMGLFALVNVGIELVAYRRLRNAPRLAPLITAIGMSILLQTLAMIIFKPNYKPYPTLLPVVRSR